MPMCDAYIPKDALPADAERKLLSRVTDLLLEHEGVDPSNEAAGRSRGCSCTATRCMSRARPPRRLTTGSSARSPRASTTTSAGRP